MEPVKYSVIPTSELNRLLEIEAKFKLKLELKEGEIDRWQNTAELYRIFYYRQIEATGRVAAKREYWHKRYKKILKKYKHVMNECLIENKGLWQM